MNDKATLTSEELFRDAEDLSVNYGDFGDRVVAELYREHPSIIMLSEADLTVAHARELRDWLNKVLP